MYEISANFPVSKFKKSFHVTHTTQKNFTIRLLKTERKGVRVKKRKKKDEIEHMDTFHYWHAMSYDYSDGQTFQRSEGL